MQKFSSKTKKRRIFDHFFASAQTVCPGCSLTRRWIPKGMLPHFGRKIHHLHGISHTHNQQTSLGEPFPGDALNKWLWHLPPEHHCSPATVPNLSLFGSSSPSMRPQLGCHPRSPMIQEPQNSTTFIAWYGMVRNGAEWYGMVWKQASGTPCINADTYMYRMY